MVDVNLIKKQTKVFECLIAYYEDMIEMQNKLSTFGYTDDHRLTQWYEETLDMLKSEKNDFYMRVMSSPNEIETYKRKYYAEHL